MAASCVYDVFLSFSGLDTRKAFTDHLLAALDQHGFYTFRDDTKLQRGEEVGPGLLKAIEESRVSVIVFSKNYASSKWCLDELVKIMDCKTTLNQIVIPIFYDIEPSNVRSQSGCYADAFASHKKEFDLKKVKIWRSALEKAGNLSGYVLQNVANRCESTCIKSVVKGLADILSPAGLSVPEYQVGIEHSVEQVTKFLMLGSNSTSNDVRIVAIWGIGGIGKTTIAKVLYNRIHRFQPFESSSFLNDVGRTSKGTDGVVKLQKQLLSDLLKNENEKIRCRDHGIEVIKCRAWRRRVLLVLDAVDNDSQLSALAINRNWLSPGSRIIVTTRDLSAIKSLQVDKVYKVENLNREESLLLFSYHAFRRDCPLESYESLTDALVCYAKGLPLLLTTLGSLLSGKAVPEWQAQLEKLKKIPRPEVQDILSQSFKSLDDKQRGLFLDIACFFVGMDQDLPIKILKGCGFFPGTDIDVLSHRCLVSIEQNRLLMHDLIQDMAREIVRQESLEEPSERSRLWYHEDVLDVLRNNMGTKKIQGLVLNLLESKELQLSWKAFTKMERLRLLQLHFVPVSGSYEYIFGRLVWLSWKGFSLECIPPTLIMDNLVAIDLSYSKLKQVWRGTKVLCKLKYLNLSHSYLLIKTPDFTGLTGLEELLLADCTKLVEVHQSIESLENLIVLDIRNCHNLKKIPQSIFMFKCLADINMSGCSKLDWLAFFRRSPPESRFSSLQLSSSITVLSMGNCNITNVPSEIGSLVSLGFLNLSGNKFSNLPATITSLPRPEILVVHKCTQLESLPDLPVSLGFLRAGDCTSLQSMSIESKAIRNQFMNFWGCPKLVNSNGAYNFRRNILRYQGHGEHQLHISLPGGEVPRWCNYQSEGYFMRFRMPQVGRILQGIIVCCVSSHREGVVILPDGVPYKANYCISNRTKTPRGPPCKVSVRLYDEQICLSYIPMAALKLCWLEDGDEVEITIRRQRAGGGLWVKRLGVSLIYEGDEKNPESYDASRHSVTTASDIIDPPSDDMDEEFVKEMTNLLRREESLLPQIFFKEKEEFLKEFFSPSDDIDEEFSKENFSKNFLEEFLKEITNFSRRMKNF